MFPTFTTTQLINICLSSKHYRSESRNCLTCKRVQSLRTWLSSVQIPYWACFWIGTHPALDLSTVSKGLRNTCTIILEKGKREPCFQERSQRSSRELLPSFLIMCLLQNHWTYNQFPYSTTFGSTQFLFNISAWLQEILLMWDTTTCDPSGLPFVKRQNMAILDF